VASDLDEKSRWATEVTGPARDVLHQSLRRLVDLPGSVSEGAKEIAQLTAWRAAQAFALNPIREALDKVKSLKDWDKPFFVAPNTTRFDWRDAPIKRFDSFEHFYQSELETTWGEWKKLQESFEEYDRGEINEGQVEAKARKSGATFRARMATVPEGGTLGDNQYTEGLTKSNVKPPSYRGGNDASYRFSVLKRDHPEIADRYIAGEFSSVAAAVRASRGISDTVECLKRLWSQATPEEQAAFDLWRQESLLVRKP